MDPKRGFLAVIVLGVLVFFGIPVKRAGAAFGQERRLNRDVPTAQAENRVALVIGNAAYRSANRLENPVNDARAMARALGEVGFEVLGPNGAGYTDLDQRGMLAAVKEFGQRLEQKPGVGLFYFAGHGVQANETNYLIPVDAAPNDATDLKYQGLDLKDVLDQFVGNRLNIVILDACRDNPFARSFKKTRSTGGDGLRQVDAPTGTFIAYATAPGKTAADGTGSNGLYTEQLLNAMKTKGLAIEQVFKRVRVAVEEKSGGTQVPWENSSLKGDFYFVPESGVAVARPPVTNPTPTKKPPTAQPATRTNKIGLDMVFVPAGSFVMGSEVADQARWQKIYEAVQYGANFTNERPSRTVTISRPFYLGKFEVTQRQWVYVAENLPKVSREMHTTWSNFKGDDLPVEMASWEECEEFIARLNRLNDGFEYAFPTEAEWEYACRAGTTGDFAGNLDELGWFADNSGNRTLDSMRVLFLDSARSYTTFEEKFLTPNGNQTHPGGQKKPNAFGLYDMHGNVAEWCADWYGDKYYATAPAVDPKGPPTGQYRILRGGGWNSLARECRASIRFHMDPTSQGNFSGLRVLARPR